MGDATTLRKLTRKVYPSRDIPGIWLAKCPELDIITQGTSETEAHLALDSAVSMWLKHCVKRGIWRRVLEERGL